jgi:hypothetical protein
VKAKHFSTNLTVKALDATPPRVTGPKSVTTTGAITLTFSEATLWKQSAATTLSVFDYSKSFSALPGTWTCKNASGGTVACDANGANVKTASFKPSSALGHGETVYVQSNAAYPMPSGIYDTSGNGLTSLFVSTTVS